MHKIIQFIFLSFILLVSITNASAEPYRIELEETVMPGTPAIHSFAFAEYGGKWLFIGGRTNGLHGFTTATSFPKQYSNKYIYVVDPSTGMTWSRNIFQDFHFSFSDQFRSTNMQYFQSGNKLYISGGYGYDSTTNGLITFSKLTVIDVNEAINAVIGGTTVSPFVRQLTDSRVQVCGGEMAKLGDYVYLAGGHVFTGPYRRVGNNQVYTNQFRRFKISDNGISLSITDYSAFTDTSEFHRRDMNLIPALSPGGTEGYMILFGGVFKNGIDLPYLNPIEIRESGISVNSGFEQKMSQYTCANMQAFNLLTGDFHSTMFAGMSLYTYDDITHELEIDSLVPFINDITTITKHSGGAYSEFINEAKFPALVGTNAKFILNPSVPHYENGVIKLNEINDRILAGHVYGGIEAVLPNNGTSYPSQRIFRVYITPETPMPVELSSFMYTVYRNIVILNWTTQSEINNRGFYVERTTSENFNSDWENLTFIPGKGNSTLTNQYVFEDNNLNTGIYRYRLKQTDFNGSFEYHELNSDVVINAPDKYELSQNYPNPFNPQTSINYSLPSDNFVSLIIYDLGGREIKTLVKEFKKAGRYEVTFNGSDVSSGIYSYVIKAGNYKEIKRMILVK